MGAGAYPSKDGSYLVRCSEEDCGRAEGAMGSVDGEAATAAWTPIRVMSQARCVRARRTASGRIGK
jgi:hypothetical protein